MTKKPETEHRCSTNYNCKECKNPIVLIIKEIDDGQGFGGTETTKFFWCNVCGEIKDDDFYDPMVGDLWVQIH